MHLDSMYAISTALAMQADRLLKEGLELAVTRSSDVDAEIQKVMPYRAALSRFLGSALFRMPLW
jgi:hypothetical protein